MKTTILTIALLLSIGCNANKDSQLTNNKLIQNNNTNLYSFEGNWAWDKNNNNNDFSIKIKKEGQFLMGSYCGVFQQGQRIDCNNDGFSFKLEYPVANEFVTNFKTNFSSANGKVKIKIEKDILIWEVIEKPQGEFYCPLKANLIRTQKK
jgi:hypothetical protein